LPPLSALSPYTTLFRSRHLEGRGPQVLQSLDIVAGRHHVSPATVALAWLLHQPHIGAPIVSATSVEQVQAMAAAPRLRLDADDRSEEHTSELQSREKLV